MTERFVFQTPLSTLLPDNANAAHYEDVLSTLRVSTQIAHHHHDVEREPLPWLDTFVRHMEALGWDTIAREESEHVYTPAPGLWTTIFKGEIPPPQAPNTRLRTVVEHLINTRSDGTRAWPSTPADSNKSTNIVTDLDTSTPGSIKIRVVHLAGATDPQAPKTRLPLARTRWEAAFAITRFDPERLKAEEAALSELSIFDL